MSAVKTTVIRSEDIREGSKNGRSWKVQNVWIHLGGLQLRAAAWNPCEPIKAGDEVIVQADKWSEKLEAVKLV